MKYLLPGFIAAHFRETGNQWLTRSEITLATGQSNHLVGSNLGNLERLGHLEKRGKGRLMEYRIKDPVLFALQNQSGKRGSTQVTPRLSKITQKFCKIYRVNEPWQATRRSEEALMTWCAMLRHG